MKKFAWVSVIIILLSLFASADILAKDGEMFGLHGNRYYIQSASKAWGVNYDAYWDIPGYYKDNVHKKRGNVVQVWTLVHAKNYDRFYTFYHVRDDLYKIRVGNRGLYLTYTKPARKRRRIELGNPSLFKVKYVGSRNFKIMSPDGKYVVCLKGQSTKKGTDLHLWTDYDASTTKWVLREKHTRNMYNPTDYYNEHYKNSKKDDAENNDSGNSNSGNQGSGNSGNYNKINLTLRNALKSSDNAEKYFSKVSYRQLKNDYKRTNVVRTLNGENSKSQLIMIYKIVKGASSNRTRNKLLVRKKIYKSLLNVRIKSGSFTTKLYAKNVAKRIKGYRSRERHSLLKKYLQRLINKL